jgi:ribonuclease BN (tRNA processing enzyme)
MRVTFIGSGDAFGSGGRFQACLLVEAAGARVLLDCGASSLVALKRAGVDPNTIDAVVVSHLHGDHFGGLPFLILDGQFSRRDRPLTLAGPPGLRDRLAQAQDAFFPGSSRTRQRFELTVVELPQRTATTVGPLAVTPFPADHASGAPAYALRLEADARTLAYSGDTAWTGALVEAAANADLFICEAYSRDKAIPFHLSYGTLLDHRAELTCRRLIVTHMSAEMLAYAPEVGADGVVAAFDGLVVDV